jgi:Flp pilus assembly protein TadG
MAHIRLQSFIPQQRNRACRRGVVALYAALTAVVLLAMTGFSVDMSRLYLQRAKAQRAADAAALAGAIQLMLGKTKSEADTAAQAIAAANGYDVAQGVAFSSIYPVAGTPNNYRVLLSRQEPLYFMPVIGLRTQTVAAPATASFTQPVQLSTSGLGNYGVEGGPVNLSLYGPYAAEENGDAYSPKYLDGVTAKYVSGARSGDPNPDYTPDGYYFFISVPRDYSTRAGNNGTTQVTVEIYDPDTHNKGNQVDADGDQRVDELRSSPFGNYPLATTTAYTLYYTNGTPDTSDDILIANASYGDDESTDLKWVQPNGFQFDLTDSRWAANAFNPDSFRINVRSTDGTSENGFLLRAGPPRASNAAFDSNNGTDITADGRIPLNFNQDGIVNIKLGYIPPGSTAFSIDKFDTDVGAQSITYSDGTLSYTGQLSANGQHLRDSYTLPAGYAGGTWTASYTAGRQDTSSWSMFYTGPSNGSPGSVHLVR